LYNKANQALYYLDHFKPDQNSSEAKKVWYSLRLNTENATLGSCSSEHQMMKKIRIASLEAEKHTIERLISEL
jgi:hypothetical protein